MTQRWGLTCVFFNNKWINDKNTQENKLNINSLRLQFLAVYKKK